MRVKAAFIRQMRMAVGSPAIATTQLAKKSPFATVRTITTISLLNMVSFYLTTNMTVSFSTISFYQSSAIFKENCYKNTITSGKSVTMLAKFHQYPQPLYKKKNTNTNKQAITLFTSLQQPCKATPSATALSSPSTLSPSPPEKQLVSSPLPTRAQMTDASSMLQLLAY